MRNGVRYQRTARLFLVRDAPEAVRLRAFRVRWTTSPIRTYVGLDMPDWRHANRAITNMSQFAPRMGMGSHRLWYLLTWDDGTRLRGRLDLVKHPSADVQILSRHVHADLAFRAGRRRPPGLSAAAYDAVVADLGADVKALAERILDGYDLGLR